MPEKLVVVVPVVVQLHESDFDAVTLFVACAETVSVCIKEKEGLAVIV